MENYNVKVKIFRNFGFLTVILHFEICIFNLRPPQARSTR